MSRTEVKRAKLTFVHGKKPDENYSIAVTTTNGVLHISYGEV